MRGDGSKPAVFAYARERRVFFRRNESYVVEFQLQRVDRLLDEVRVAFCDVQKFRSRDAHEEHALLYVAEASGLEPGIERLAIDLLFESAENSHPRIQYSGGGSDKRHSSSLLDRSRVGRIRAKKKCLNYAWPEEGKRCRHLLVGREVHRNGLTSDASVDRLTPARRQEILC